MLVLHDLRNKIIDSEVSDVQSILGKYYSDFNIFLCDFLFVGLLQVL